MVRESMPSTLLCNWQEAVSRLAVDLDFDFSGDNKLHWFKIWKHSFIKTCAVIDQELKHHRRIDSYYSGTTALLIVRQAVAEAKAATMSIGFGQSINIINSTLATRLLETYWT